MTFETSFRGLWIAYEVDEYDPGVHTYSNGDPGYPPSGGQCESWEVEDIDNVFEFVAEISESWEPPSRWRLGSRMVRWLTLAMLQRYRQMRPKEQLRMLRIAQSLAAEHWADEIEEHCTEHYWHDIGGPAGERDYFYDG